MTEKGFGEKCAIFGVYGMPKEAARLTYFGLYALQHRGQESSGICSSDGEHIRTHKGSGLVAQVYDDNDLDYLHGYIAIGHNRYSTSGGSLVEHNQPIIRGEENLFALAHNGNIPSTKKLEKFLGSKNINCSKLNDSEMMAECLKVFVSQNLSLPESFEESFQYFNGAYSLVIMDHENLIGIRDPHGIKPLSLGKLNGGYVLSSETCAFSTIGAEFIREIEPGEMVIINEKGIESRRFAKGNLKFEIFEFVYFARPDSNLMGKSVNEVRRNFGKLLAKSDSVKADVVIPVPDSSIPAAIGYSEESGIKFDFGLNKNRYIHRTFIRPAQYLRDRDVALKLIPMPEILAGKKVVVLDDSIVRGTTTKKLVKMIRDAGAIEVHLRISSPPIKFPDFYGIDMPNQKDLIAAEKSIEEIRKEIGADSLLYLDYKDMIKATGLPESKFCTAIFTGKYPIEIGEENEEKINFEV